MPNLQWKYNSELSNIIETTNSRIPFSVERIEHILPEKPLKVIFKLWFGLEDFDDVFESQYDAIVSAEAYYEIFRKSGDFKFSRRPK